MADRSIVIAGNRIVHGTGVKESIEKNQADTTATFDGNLAFGSDSVSYKLTIDRIAYQSMAAYQTYSRILKQMLSQKREISTYEIVRFNNAAYRIIKHYHGCILDGKDYEMKPEELSTQNLSFICEDMEEIVEPYEE